MKHQLPSPNDDETFCRRSPNETTTTTSRLPPSAPPPSYPMVDYTMVHPPPYNFAHHIYDAIEPKSQHKWMFCAAVFELFFGLVGWSIAITCAVIPSLQVYFPLYTGCWATSFYVINAIIGIIAAKRGTANFFVAHIVFSVLSIVCSVILATLSILNWYNAGTKDLRQNYCIVSRFDQEAFKVLWREDKYDFDYCLYTFKLGVTLNMILVLIAIVLVALSLIVFVERIFGMGSDFNDDHYHQAPLERSPDGFSCQTAQCSGDKNESCVIGSEVCTVHTGLTIACFALWTNSTQYGVKIVLKGCWPSQPEMGQCDPERCVTDRLQTKKKAGGETYFCCCEKSNCNDKVYFEPKLTSTIEPLPSPLPVEEDNVTTIVIILGTLIILALFVFFAYWMWRRYNLCKNSTNSMLPPQSPPVQPLLQPVDWSAANLISRGRYGAVYKAMMGDKLVAAKVFPAQDWESWTLEQDIYQVHSLRSHDNILRFLGAEVRGCGQSTEYLLITTYHENGSLYDYIKAHIVTFREMLHISVSMLRGLAFLHEEVMSPGDNCYKPTIVHRDFKSRNVLLKKDLTACIGDFGLALKCEHGRTPKDTHGQVGTRRYMAPEVLEGATEFSAFAFKQIDVYAAALVMWEVLSRCAIVNGPVDEYKLPFEEEVGSKPSLTEMQNVVVTQRLRPKFKPSWLAHSIGREVCQTIQEMWDNEFEARVTAGGALERLLLLDPTILSNNYSSLTTSNDKLQECLPLIMDFSNNSSIV